MSSNDRNTRSPAVRRFGPVGAPDDVEKRGQQIIERALHEITQLSPPKQAAVGGISGIAAGYCFAKASKMVAFAIGASVLGLAIANQSGYVDIHFDRIRDSAERRLNQVQRVAASQLPSTTIIDEEEVENIVDQSSNNVVEKIKRFALTNFAITSSFVGGFLLGIAFE